MLTKKLSLALLGAFLSLPLGTLANFPDVEEAHPNYTAINWAQELGIVEGYNDGTFRPSATMNRAEFTKTIIAAHSTRYAIETCQLQDFLFYTDTIADAWYSPYLCLATKNNIVSGYPDITFRPASTINIAEAAKIIALLYDAISDSRVLIDPENYPSLRPRSGEPWYQVYINYLTAKNALPQTLERFDAPITRGDMVEILYRLNVPIITEIPDFELPPEDIPDFELPPEEIPEIEIPEPEELEQQIDFIDPKAGDSWALNRTQIINWTPMVVGNDIVSIELIDPRRPAIGPVWSSHNKASYGTFHLVLHNTYKFKDPKFVHPVIPGREYYFVLGTSEGSVESDRFSIVTPSYKQGNWQTVTGSQGDFSFKMPPNAVSEEGFVSVTNGEQLMVNYPLISPSFSSARLWLTVVNKTLQEEGRYFAGMGGMFLSKDGLEYWHTQDDTGGTQTAAKAYTFSVRKNNKIYSFRCEVNWERPGPSATDLVIQKELGNCLQSFDTLEFSE